jgi:hypothetical protein
VRLFWIALGGAVGTCARYLLSGWALDRFGPAFPFGTLAVNVIGSFLLAGLVQDIYRRWVDRWRAEDQPAAEQIYCEATQRFVEMANSFLERLGRSGEAAFLTLPRALGPEVGFRTKSRLFYTEMLTLTARSPLAWLLDQLRPQGAARQYLHRSTGDYLEHLLTRNAARIMNDLNERVLESRRRLESEVRACLREVYASAERALDDARAQRAAGEPTVRIALERIERRRREVHVLSTA